MICFKEGNIDTCLYIHKDIYMNVYIHIFCFISVHAKCERNIMFFVNVLIICQGGKKCDLYLYSPKHHICKPSRNILGYVYTT